MSGCLKFLLIVNRRNRGLIWEAHDGAVSGTFLGVKRR